MLRSLLILVVVCAACGGSREAPAPKPKGTTAAAFDPALASRDPVALAAAVRRPARALLPSYRLHVTSKITVSEGGKAVETLDEDAHVERAQGGELHASYANSREQGRELFAAGGTVWVRPRYGKFHRRPPAEPDEAERTVDETGGTLSAYLDLVLPGAACSDGGAATAAGRPARRVKLAPGRGPARPAPRSPGEAWRAGLTVDALRGELLLDAATGALLEGTLDGQVSFVREGHKLTMALAASQTIADVGGAVAITPPADSESSATPGRLSEVADRETLLGGLAAPASQGAKIKP